MKPAKLEERLSALEGKKIAMEVVPLEILKASIEECLSQRAGKYAAPEEVEILGLAFEPSNVHRRKDWGIRSKIRFRREIIRIEAS